LENKYVFLLFIENKIIYYQKVLCLQKKEDIQQDYKDTKEVSKERQRIVKKKKEEN